MHYCNNAVPQCASLTLNSRYCVVYTVHLTLHTPHPYAGTAVPEPPGQGGFLHSVQAGAGGAQQAVLPCPGLDLTATHGSLPQLGHSQKKHLQHWAVLNCGGIYMRRSTTISTSLENSSTVFCECEMKHKARVVILRFTQLYFLLCD